MGHIFPYTSRKLGVTFVRKFHVNYGLRLYLHFM